MNEPQEIKSPQPVTVGDLKAALADYQDDVEVVITAINASQETSAYAIQRHESLEHGFVDTGWLPSGVIALAQGDLIMS